ncbi:MAG: TlpA family protein disulfide reductase [Acidobacteria bacterium]|nr:TlpA family protein disulfide reductase [Acidobacteriota bacterium]
MYWFLALALTFFSPACQRPWSANGVDIGNIGDFTLPNVRGGTFRLQDHQGRVLLLAFLQTQPDTGAENPSRSLVPSLLSMDHQYGKAGLEVVMIDATVLARPKARRIEEKSAGLAPPMAMLLNTSYNWGLTLPLLADPQGAAAKLLHVETVPTLILMDGKGKVARRWTTVPHPGDLAAAIQQFTGGPMAGKPPVPSP